tara:strand:+ start:5837 stop:6016 length:180 start_codon:yes stop_codon:yes gene_type:complete
MGIYGRISYGYCFNIMVPIDRNETMSGIKNPQQLRAKLGDSFPVKKKKKKPDWKKGQSK